MNHTIKKGSNLPALLFWTGVWWLGAKALGNALLLPTPWQVLRCLTELAVTEVFRQTVALSIGRILLGVVTSVLLGVVLAVLTTRSRLAHMLIAPAMTAMQVTPVASFTILVLIWLDRDWVPVLICAMMVLPVIWNDVSTGIQTVDVQLLEMAKVFRLSKTQVLKRIYLPSVLPFFRTACSSALGLGWKAGIAAEVIGLPTGSLGENLYNVKVYYMTADLFAWTAVIVVVSVVFEKLFLKIIDTAAGKAGG